MPQVFQPHHPLVIKLVVLAIILFAIGATIIARLAIRPDYSLGQPVDQPVPFSHRHHVNDVGLDCRYCHADVEKSSFAGMPPTHTCLTCHSQLFRHSPMLAPVFKSFAENRPIQWNRVNRVPDFVYFDHGIHVNKGIGCVSCHGQVDTMPLTARAQSLQMQWCLACHRDPAQHLRPHEHVFDLHWLPTRSDLAQIARLAAANGKMDGQGRDDPNTRLLPVDQMKLEQAMARTLDVANGRLTETERRTLGRLLAHENHLQSTQRLTDCSTCHR